jgi:cytoskeletal protein RodZ
VSGNEPPEDPSEAPTGYYDYGSQEEGEEGDPERSGPWYRRPIIFLTVAFVAVFLLGIALYYFADQTKGTGGTRQTPTSPTMSTPAPTTPSGVSTTTEPATPTETTAPPSTTEPTTTAPTTTTTSDEGHHHHHHHDGGTP